MVVYPQINLNHTKISIIDSISQKNLWQLVKNPELWYIVLVFQNVRESLDATSYSLRSPTSFIGEETCELWACWFLWQDHANADADLVVAGGIARSFKSIWCHF